MKWLVSLSLLIAACPGFSMRNIFKQERQMIFKSIIEISPDHLHMIGYLKSENLLCAFLEDNMGSIYPVKLGHAIGGEKYQVMKIEKQRVLLFNGQHFTVIQ